MRHGDVFAHQVVALVAVCQRSVQLSENGVTAQVLGAFRGILME